MMLGAYRRRALTLFTVSLLLLAAGAHPAKASLCGSTQKKNPILGTYAVVTGATATLALWRHHPTPTHPYAHEIPASIDGCTLIVDNKHPHEIGGFVHDFEGSDGNTISGDQIGVKAIPTGKTSASIVFRLKSREGVAAGTYNGTFQLDNTEKYGHSTTIPATITLQYDGLWNVILIPWLLTLIIGMAAIWLKLRVANQPFIAPATALSLGAAVAAAGGIWKTQYLTVSSWGGSLSDFWGLVTLMLSAFIAAGTTVSVATDSAAAATNSITRRRAQRDRQT